MPKYLANSQVSFGKMDWKELDEKGGVIAERFGGVCKKNCCFEVESLPEALAGCVTPFPKPKEKESSFKSNVKTKATKGGE